jgi:serine/threonine protein kinase
MENGKAVGEGKLHKGRTNRLLMETMFPQFEGEYFEGEFLNGRPHLGSYINLKNGEATVTFLDGTLQKVTCYRFLNGNIYTGNLNVEGDPHGSMGKMMFKDGPYISYDGSWDCGHMEGSGILTTRSGDQYIGEMKQSTMQGEGVMIMKSKGVLISTIREYSGRWEGGKYHGRGVMTCSTESFGISYLLYSVAGEWLESKLVSCPTVTYADGSVYVGEWNAKDGVRCGRGTLTYPRGDVMKTVFNTVGKAEGKGTYRFKNGDVYEGDFVDDRFNGKGTLHRHTEGTLYEGSFLNSRQHGAGTLTYIEEGSIFEGEWLSGSIADNGTWMKRIGSTNGKPTYDVYSGKLNKSFQLHGEGRIMYANGMVVEGTFNEGLKEGKCTYTFPDPVRTLSGEFDGDKLLDALKQKELDQLIVLASITATKTGSSPPNIPYSLLVEWTDNMKTCLGAGGFGAVYEATVGTSTSSSITKMAVKVLNAAKLEMPKGSEVNPAVSVFHLMKNEINTLRSFIHPNIIRLIGYHLPESISLASSSASFLSPDRLNNLCLVYELANKGSLDKYFVEGADDMASLLDWKKRMRIALQVASALSYLHCSKKYPAYHRDIKAANVALHGVDYTAKLIDCGMSRFAPDDHSSSSIKLTSNGGFYGTITYADAEYRDGIIDYDVRCDMYSFGILLLELYAGRLHLYSVEYRGMIKCDFRKRKGVDLLECDPRAGDWNRECAEGLKEIALKCTAEERDDRYASMGEIIKKLSELEQKHFHVTDIEQVALREMKSMREFIERETAIKILREREDKESEDKNKRTCIICYEDGIKVSDGVECQRKTDVPHFYCQMCFKDNVTQQLTEECRSQFIKNNCNIMCLCCNDTKDATFWTDKALAVNVEDGTFALYLKVCSEVLEVQIQKKERREAEERIVRMRSEMEELIKKCHDASTLRVYGHRMHIIENILTLRCPKCRTPFIDFNGCFALSCTSCNKSNFCGWCLKDCGADAHSHVARCPDSLSKGQVFSSQELFNNVHCRKRGEKIAEYLQKKVEAGDRKILLDTMKVDLDDLKIVVKL